MTCVSYSFIFCLFLNVKIFAQENIEENKGKPHEYTLDTFEKNVALSPHFVMFYAPWCGHCKRLHPTWDQLGEKYNTDGNVITIAKVDCTKYTAVCSAQEVTGYPTLKFYAKGSSDGIKYRGTRELAAFEKFVAEQLDLDVESDDETPKPSSGLIEFTDETFEEKIKKGTFFVKFYAPWCGHCQRLAPTWDLLASTFGYDERVGIGKLDCTKFSSICTIYEVKGYPTLLWMEDGKVEAKYTGERTLDALKKFAAEKLSGHEKPLTEKEHPAQSDSAVVTLTSQNFENAISTGITLIKFFAPWCGHCKRLAPTYEELGKEFVGNHKVTIAKVDCTLDINKELCSEQKVTGFPTLILYKEGAQVDQYRGDRSLKDLAIFVTSKINHEEL